jgi:hypothetical protein
MVTPKLCFWENCKVKRMLSGAENMLAISMVLLTACAMQQLLKVAVKLN